jgi:hypothetical protein
MNWSRNCRIAGGSTFRLIPDFMPQQKTWRDYKKEIFISVAAVLFFTVIMSIVHYQVSRPVMDVNSRDQAVSIKLDNGTILKPGDSGFNEARKVSRHQPVQ